MNRKILQMRELSEDLENLLNHKMTSMEFYKKYSDIEIPKEFNRIWEDLDHFLSDEDIREKDANYCEMQETEMKKFISLLRSGANVKELYKINFLSYSDRR